jgi:hypothetical protein
VARIAQEHATTDYDLSFDASPTVVAMLTGKNHYIDNLREEVFPAFLCDGTGDLPQSAPLGYRNNKLEHTKEGSQ